MGKWEVRVQKIGNFMSFVGSLVEPVDMNDIIGQMAVLNVAYRFETKD
jgi:hypothetical protein